MPTIDVGRIKLVWRADYNALSSYNIDDVVYYQGSSWICTEPIVGATPVEGSQYWDLAAKGYIPGEQLVRTVTIADLKALTVANLTDTSVVIVAGYYEAVDGGGGVFYWDASSTGTADDGRYILPDDLTGADPGRWIRLLNSERASVKMWGAVGDGNTDDTVAIQSSLTAMTSAWATELVFPAGNYKVTSTLTIPSSMLVRGEENASITMAQGTPSDILSTANPISNGVTVDNLALIFAGYGADGTTNKANAALALGRTTGKPHVVRNVKTIGGGIGISCTGIDGKSVKFENITTDRAYLAGIKILPASGSNEAGNVSIDGFQMIAPWSTTGSAIWLVNESSTINLKNFSLSGSFAKGVIDWDVPLLNADDYRAKLTVENGVVYGTRVGATDFVNLSSASSTLKVPAVQISSITLHNCANIINDAITTNTVASSALSGTMENVPFNYDASLTSTAAAIRQVRGDASICQFIPTSEGWYRIFRGSSRGIVGNFSIASRNDSTNFDVVFNHSSGTFLNVTRHNQGVEYVKKARAVQLTDGTYYLDIYVLAADSNNSEKEQTIAISYPTAGRDLIVDEGFVAPTLLGTLNASTVSRIEEVRFDSGIVTSNGGATDGHLVIGDNHIFFEDGKYPRHYNNGVEVLFLGGGGSGATGKAYINNGAISFVKITSGGTGYTSAPTVLIITQSGSGSGAVVTASISAGSVVYCTVTSGGTGYGPAVTNTSGRRFLFDQSGIGLNSYVGEMVHNMRMIDYERYALTTPGSNSYYATGTNVLTWAFPGDKLYGPNGQEYEILCPVDNNTVAFTAPYPTQVTSQYFVKNSWAVLPEINGYKYRILAVHMSPLESTAWTASIDDTALAVRAKGSQSSTTANTFAYRPDDNIDPGGDSITDSDLLKFINNTTNNGIRPWTAGQNGVGIAGTTPNSHGVSVEFVKNSDRKVYLKPLTGSQILVYVLGMKLLNVSNY